MKTKFTIGVFGVIFDDKGRVLLCHRRDYDLWNLPGGGMESGESLVDCLTREVAEETGLKVKVNKLVGVYNKPEKDDVVFCFTCKVIGGKIALNEEADQVEYFSVDSLPSNTVPKQVERIKDAIDYEGEVVFKTQVGKSAIELLKEGKLQSPSGRLLVPKPF